MSAAEPKATKLGAAHRRARVRGRLAAALPALALALAWSGAFGGTLSGASAPTAAAPSSPAPRVVVIDLQGIVEPITAEYVTRGIAYANRTGAAAVLLELSTPGGLDTSMRQIIEAILASRAPVIGYVYPSGARSASAGFYILESCDVAAMAPGTNTGAAHPVVLGGAQPDKIEATKIQNDADAYMRSLAARRHRNVAAAESAVLQSKSFTENEALANQLINLIADSPEQLLAKLSGQPIRRVNGATDHIDFAGARFVPYTMSLRERVLDMNPDLAFALLAIGALLIYIEFTHPGVIVPGVAGVILLALGLFALSLLPLNWAGAGLLILAFVLFILEAKFPSHGILAAGGIVGMVLGAVLLVDTSVPGLRIHMSIALAVALPIAAITVFLMRLVLRARAHKVVTGEQGLVGQQAVARSPLAPQGRVWVHGELWQAHSSAPVETGALVKIRAVHGLVLEVEPVTQEQTAQAQGQGLGS
ncbi:MAG TPA: nodulation protein NfeD [Terriglobales bacterium]|nr:nodulation protein NfeD [Terriglobales bacterium]